METERVRHEHSSALFFFARVRNGGAYPAVPVRGRSCRALSRIVYFPTKAASWC
jgi:hypothetical protein